jgi:hypothetical protein
MDIVYLGAIVALWAVSRALAAGCETLENAR